MAAPTQARITSTEALETFRAALIVFLSKARRSLDDTSDEVRRTRQWVQHDQRVHWEGEFRRRKKRLEQAQQELMSAKLEASGAGGKGQQSLLLARQMAVAKAQRDIADAENKIRKLKGWGTNFDSAADPVIKRMDKLHHTLAEFPKAIAYLVAVQKTLDAYSESSRPVQDGSQSLTSMAAELGIEPDAAPVAGETATAEAVAGETAAPETLPEQSENHEANEVESTPPLETASSQESRS